MDKVVSKIDLKKVSGIQFDPDAKEITSRVVDELDYIRGLIRLLSNLEDDSEKTPGDFGSCLVFGWVLDRLEATRNHISAILKEKFQAGQKTGAVSVADG